MAIDTRSISQFPKSVSIPGGQSPSGHVRVSGAKNSATRLLAASMLSDKHVVLKNFPTMLIDAQHKISFMRELGIDISVNHENDQVEIVSECIRTKEVTNFDIPIRTTYLLAAGQLAHNNFARIPYPGGCKIGSRGYDLHIMVWNKFNCDVIEGDKFIEISGKLSGAIIDFPISTVGGTENALLCASVASGNSEIKNAYITPEIIDLINLLRRMGAIITIFGNSLIKVQGTGSLLDSAHMKVMPDRIETLTWIVLAVLTHGTITIEDVPFDHMEVPFIHLKDAGLDLFRNSNSIIVTSSCSSLGYLQPFELACGTHPGIISDMQPFFVLLGLAAEGTSKVFDYRYPERIGYITELNKFCKKTLEAKKGEITIKGISKFDSAIANSTDLRGSMALIIAAFATKQGQSTINDVSMALRGYNNLSTKLKSLGLIFEEIY